MRREPFESLQESWVPVQTMRVPFPNQAIPNAFGFRRRSPIGVCTGDWTGGTRKARGWVETFFSLCCGYEALMSVPCVYLDLNATPL